MPLAATDLNPFLTATMRVFMEMFRIKVEALKPSIIDMRQGHRWEISAVIGVTGEMKGGVSIRLNQALCNNLLLHASVELEMEGEDHVDDMIQSMVGEVANIIAGNALSLFAERDIQLTSPLVIQGRNHRITWPRLTPTICVPFRSVHGSFEVALCLERSDPV